ncbi:MAG TPA: thiamine pyrophosphate-requiring protein [Thermomicrobiales bacterium]|nr:thiamine pyrophosphate-requiring protein [Thermomicrobiales bacterium]
MAKERFVSDDLVQRLQDWGVHRVFGFSGDGINPILGAFNRAENPPEFFQVRHEETAALLATAHAKYTGEVGVCLSTQGPGAVHMLNGLYDAKLDHQPVVAIVGQISGMSAGSHFQQEIDLSTLFKDVASAFVEVASAPESVNQIIDRAFRTAISQRTVTCVIVPHDTQRKPAVEHPPVEHGAMHPAVGIASKPRVVPEDADLKRAADILNAGRKVAILVGAGALDATDEVIAVAERLGAGVAKALLGKAVVPDDLPYVTGSVGWLGTIASNRMMTECDTLLMIGSTFPYTEFLPTPGQARGIQIDLNAGMLGMRYPMEVNLVGGSAETLDALLPMLDDQSVTSWRSTIEGYVREWDAEAGRRAQEPATPVNPIRYFTELSPRLPDNCILSADSGTSTVWYARHLKMRRGMMGSVSGTLATMGCALPYALAAKVAYPDRVCFALLGDGAMQMNGLNQLVTVAEQWRNWDDPRLIIFVIHNNDLAYVTWEQRAMEGDPQFAGSQQVPDFPYADYANMLGLHGIRIDSPDQIGSMWDEALASDRPVVIDALADPNVPTIPPEPTEQIREKIASALSREPDEAHVHTLLEQSGTELPEG